jgi:type IV secretory pathway VirB10-like protein
MWLEPFSLSLSLHSSFRRQNDDSSFKLSCFGQPMQLEHSCMRGGRPLSLTMQASNFMLQTQLLRNMGAVFVSTLSLHALSSCSVRYPYSETVIQRITERTRQATTTTAHQPGPTPTNHQALPAPMMHMPLQGLPPVLALTDGVGALPSAPLPPAPLPPAAPPAAPLPAADAAADAADDAADDDAAAADDAEAPADDAEAPADGPMRLKTLLNKIKMCSAKQKKIILKALTKKSVAA